MRPISARSIVHAGLNWLFPFLLALAAAVPAMAQNAEDPPARVGRLGEVIGQVWLYSPDSGEWISAVRNRPITTGDRLSTEGDGRAEVSIGSTTVRLDAASELEVLALDDDQISLQLHRGSASARLRDAAAVGDFEMQAAEGRFTVQTPGSYRFDRRTTKAA